MKKSVRKSKININFSNRWLYTLILIGVVLVAAVGVYATTATSGVTPGGTPNPGHPINQIGAPTGCTSGQVLTYNVDSNGVGSWTCTTPSSGSGVSGCAWTCSNWLTSSVNTNDLTFDIDCPSGTLPLTCSTQADDGSTYYQSVVTQMLPYSTIYSGGQKIHQNGCQVLAHNTGSSGQQQKRYVCALCCSSGVPTPSSFGSSTTEATTVTSG